MMRHGKHANLLSHNRIHNRIGKAFHLKAAFSMEIHRADHRMMQQHIHYAFELIE